MFTDPPLAVIGELKPNGTVTGSASYTHQGRAKVDACSGGLIRIYADRDGGAVTAAVLYGPAMDHIAHLLAWAIERGETASKMLELPFYHPTFEEGLRPALRQICEVVKATDKEHFDDMYVAGS
jgi:dihydrolipoamide dehydrogenase